MSTLIQIDLSVSPLLNRSLPRIGKGPVSYLEGRVFFYSGVPFFAYRLLDGNCALIRMKDCGVVGVFNGTLENLFFSKDPFGFKQDKSFLNLLKHRLDLLLKKPCHDSNCYYEVRFDQDALLLSRVGWKLEEAVILMKNNEIKTSLLPPKEGAIVKYFTDQQFRRVGHAQIASIQRFGKKYLYTYAIYLSEHYMRRSEKRDNYVLVDNCIDIANWLTIQDMKEEICIEHVLVL